LKDEIIQRDGKVVIRPDSGDPVKIICGDPMAQTVSPEFKGAVECLWEIFSGTETQNGFKQLDPHIGLIYGDSITLQRAEEILKQLKTKGFASTNIVFGVGSFTYQYVTRDNFGFAMKATSGVVNGKRRDIAKNPKTDKGNKKSAKGLLRIEKKNGELILHDQQTVEQEAEGELKCVFLNGKIIETYSLQSIRQRLNTE
jgi:nicotinamide phosphoribosyltransferase